MTQEQKEYIEANIELIENNEWNKFFQLAPASVGGILFSAGVDFLTKIDYVPNGAFLHCDDLLTITLPDNIYNIAPWAFNYCKNLKTVVLSKNLKIIDTRAFNKCESLTDVDFPEGLTDINTFAFHHCVDLEKVHIPASIVNICSNAFSHCGHIDIVYDGTKEDWAKRIRYDSFNGTSYTCTCTDGTVYN